MNIRYLGHSCFVFTASTGTRIVTDPYGDIGFSMPSVEADAVTVSHGHYDHCNVRAVTGSPVVIDRAGKYEAGGVSITATESFHDGVGGKKRGKNLIFKFRMDGLEVCHLGDLGEECSPRLIERLLPVHVLLIPVGGTYTIDAKQAKEYVDTLKPSVVIPMHYKTKGLNIDVGKVDAFTDLFGDKDAVGEKVVELGGSDIRLSRDDIAKDSTKIIVMERYRI